ncbi:BRR6 [Ecytonucleospora hepatopenaei]|uniref:BRR6 n=1 Tax=Ecytonucleospora hepatopenaei TaxID=646526 RepID=A0A1W0E4L3_9MICR|nr:BRR6 [Ecytonucleospora hepatopenaei]
MTSKVSFSWKGRPKVKDFSEFLINKQQPLRLTAPKENNEIHEIIDADVPEEKPKTTAIAKIGKTTRAIAHYSSLPVKYTFLPIKYTCEYSYEKIKRMKISPNMLIGYIHVILNLFVTCCFIYIFGFMIYFLKIDVMYKINERREIMKGIITNTKTKYAINKCDPATRVPAMEKQCAEWENILKNGFSALNYTKIIIELIAGAIDSFVSKITYKTLITVGFLMIFYLKYKR